MAQLTSESSRPLDQSLPEGLVRTLRHEIGDLLQKVYASIAILQDRLPADRAMERGVLARLWSRSEKCKQNLDIAHDFVCPLTLGYQPVDLTIMARALAESAKGRYPRLELVTESAGPAMIHADERRVSQIGDLLLTNACEAAQSRVSILTQVDPKCKEATWIIRDDGPGIKPELATKLFRPFFTTRGGHSGLGLALAQKLVVLHGGQIKAGNLFQGGFEAQVRFPQESPNQEGAI